MLSIIFSSNLPMNKFFFFFLHFLVVQKRWGSIIYYKWLKQTMWLKKKKKFSTHMWSVCLQTLHYFHYIYENQTNRLFSIFLISLLPMKFLFPTKDGLNAELNVLTKERGFTALECKGCKSPLLKEQGQKRSTPLLRV